MTVIHQVIVGASPGDAITNLAIEIRDRLRRTLGDSEIFARYIDPAIAGEVHGLSEFSLGRPRSITIYHSSIGEPDVTRFLLELPTPLVLVYHNITPFEHFVEIDPSFASRLAWGRSELTILRPRVVVATADSSYNAEDLRGAGYHAPLVLPLGVRPDRLLQAPADPAMIRQLGLMPGPFVVAIGQQLPHKRVEHVVEAVHILDFCHGVRPTLIIAGRPTFDSYARGVEEFARQLALPSVYFTGGVTDTALAAILRRAAVYVSASDHEGLGVPALEAMAFGVPVVVRDSGAVRETIDDGGLILDGEASPAHLAEGLRRVLLEPVLAAQLSEAGRRRIDRWDADEVLDTFESALLEII